MSLSSKNQNPPDNRISTIVIVMGLSAFFLGISLGALILFPSFSQELGYYSHTQLGMNVPGTSKDSDVPVPIDTKFGIVVPKIRANAVIVADVDPRNALTYQHALSKGVAHALGSAYPGQHGNVFLFAHSSANWYEANRYNSVFYLIHHLEKGDELYLYYQNRKYEYVVSDKKLTDPSEIKYLNSQASDETVTLMTCWPPGTTLQRLIVIAKLKSA